MTQRCGAHQSASTVTARVIFSISGCTVECGPEHILLEAGEAAGVPLPSNCRDGTCGKCRTKLLSSPVDMRHQGSLLPQHMELGYILTCCSRPLTEVVIEC